MNSFKKTDISMALLRMLMCFGVLLAHCWNKKGYDSIFFLPFKEIQVLAAPIFMFLSFYFSYRVFLSRDQGRFLSRMKRLLIPQIGWTLIYWALFQFIEKVTFSELLWQLFTGHSTVLNATMWFQIELILITILFYLIFSALDNRKAISLLCMIMILSFLMQFSGFNLLLFDDLRFELKYPLGRFSEMLPYAITGFFFGYYDVMKKLKEHRLIIAIISLLLLPLPYLIDFPVSKGFGYSGTTIFYLSILMTLFVEMLPFDLLHPTIKKAAILISSYTPGIYCCHRLVFTFLSHFFPAFAFSSFAGCIFLYLICYMICLMIFQVPNRYIKMLVS